MTLGLHLVRQRERAEVAPLAGRDLVSSRRREIFLGMHLGDHRRVVRDHVVIGRDDQIDAIGDELVDPIAHRHARVRARRCVDVEIARYPVRRIDDVLELRVELDASRRHRDPLGRDRPFDAAAERHVVGTDRQRDHTDARQREHAVVSLERFVELDADVLRELRFLGPLDAEDRQLAGHPRVRRCVEDLVGQAALDLQLRQCARARAGAERHVDRGATARARPRPGVRATRRDEQEQPPDPSHPCEC